MMMKERCEAVPPKTGTLKKHENFEDMRKISDYSALIPDLWRRVQLRGYFPRSGKSIMMKEIIKRLEKEGKNVLVVDKKRKQ